MPRIGFVGSISSDPKYDAPAMRPPMVNGIVITYIDIARRPAFRVGGALGRHEVLTVSHFRFCPRIVKYSGQLRVGGLCFVDVLAMPRAPVRHVWSAGRRCKVAMKE